MNPRRPRVRSCVRFALLAFIGFLALSLPPAAPTARADDDEPKKRWFYFGYDYGSQSLFNPMYVILNRGFDVLQLAPHDRNIFAQNYLTNVRNVWNNVANPFPPIADRGYWRFTREELLPLSWTADTARWTPNYGLHLIGGGETYWALREWFLDRDASDAEATAFSVATMYTAAFLNESIENANIVGFNTDCLADLYVFDSAGIILYSLQPIRTLFSKYLVIADWSLQPAFTYPHGDIHNQGNYYSAKFPIPFYPRLGLFGYMGFSNMAGLTFKVDREYSISAAAGGKISHIANETDAAVLNVVNFKKAGAIFVDRNNSLLASLHVSDVQDYFIQLNVYPNAFYKLDPGIGFFGVLAKDGRFVGGVSFAHSLGFGFGAGTL